MNETREVQKILSFLDDNIEALDRSLYHFEQFGNKLDAKALNNQIKNITRREILAEVRTNIRYTL